MSALKRKHLARLAQLDRLLEAGEQLSIEAAVVSGAGPRVLLGAGTLRLCLKPAAARELALKFEDDNARALELDDIGTALRDAADAADAHQATRQ